MAIAYDTTLLPAPGEIAIRFIDGHPDDGVAPHGPTLKPLRVTVIKGGQRRIFKRYRSALKFMGRSKNVAVVVTN